MILIKLADRLEVMRNLRMFPREKWRKKSWESMNLYAQIAHKLGLYSIKNELEDIALSYLEPAEYEHIHRKLEETERERQTFIDRFLAPIVERLDRQGFNYHVKSRTKSIFSIWTKMHKQHVPFEGVYDIFALRIILDCPPEEEKTSAGPSTRSSPTTTSPIPNGCATGFDPQVQRLRVAPHHRFGRRRPLGGDSDPHRADGCRGRTRHRGALALQGGGQSGALTSEMWLGRLRELMEENTPHALAQRFDSRPSSGEIFVFTPNGDLRKLPRRGHGTRLRLRHPLNLGCSCSGGKINGRAVPIKETLHNGDIVEILTQKNQTPKADWLSAVKTAKARSKIKAFIREEQAKSARLGREELERKLKNWKFGLTIDEAVGYLCKYYKLKAGTELYGLIATEKIDLATVKEILTRWQSGEADEERRSGRRSRSRPSCRTPPRGPRIRPTRS